MTQDIEKEVKVRLFGTEEVNSIPWENMHRGEEMRFFLEPILKKGIKEFINNVNVELKIATVGNLVIPLTVDKFHTDNRSYITSLSVQIIDYVKEEISEGEKYSSLDKFFVKTAFPIFRALASKAFANTVQVNNWFVSTNLYPKLKPEQIKALIDVIEKAYPQKTIVFKGVEESTQKEIKELLARHNFKDMVSRQVYVLDPEKSKYKKKRPYIQDRKLSERNEKYKWVELKSISDQEATRIKELYDKLYLEKYSQYNPFYTIEFIKNTCDSGVLRYFSLFDQDKIIAVQAIAHEGGVVTTPFIGYDQSYPKEDGLYRLMNIQLTEFAVEHRSILNMSSGAASFKKQRGGVPHFEYNMCKFDGAPRYDRLLWRFMTWYSEHSVKPNMIKLGV